MSLLALPLAGLVLPLACSSPPATIGVRDGGSLPADGELELGGAAAIAAGGGTWHYDGDEVEGAALLDGVYAFGDTVGLGLGGGWYAGEPQVQLDLRMAPPDHDGFRVALVYGWAFTAYDGFIAHGPYMSTTMRLWADDAHGGPLLGAALHVSFSGHPDGWHQAWVQPTVGWSGRGDRLHWGLQFTPMFADGDLDPAVVPVAQLWLRHIIRVRRPRSERPERVRDRWRGSDTGM